MNKLLYAGKLMTDPVIKANEKTGRFTCTLMFEHQLANRPSERLDIKVFDQSLIAACSVLKGGERILIEGKCSTFEMKNGGKAASITAVSAVSVTSALTVNEFCITGRIAAAPVYAASADGKENMRLTIQSPKGRYNNQPQGAPDEVQVVVWEKKYIDLSRSNAALFGKDATVCLKGDIFPYTVKKDDGKEYHNYDLVCRWLQTMCPAGTANTAFAKALVNPPAITVKPRTYSPAPPDYVPDYVPDSTSESIPYPDSDTSGNDFTQVDDSGEQLPF